MLCRLTEASPTSWLSLMPQLSRYGYLPYRASRHTVHIALPDKIGTGQLSTVSAGQPGLPIYHRWGRRPSCLPVQPAACCACLVTKACCEQATHVGCAPCNTKLGTVPRSWAHCSTTTSSSNFSLALLKQPSFQALHHQMRPGRCSAAELLSLLI